jgi:hypothetical protein
MIDQNTDALDHRYAALTSASPLAAPLCSPRFPRLPSAVA